MTYPICLLVFRTANRRNERYVSSYYKKKRLLRRTLVYSTLFVIQTNGMFQSLLDLLLLTLRFGENKQVDLGLQEFLLLGKKEDVAIKFARIVSKWGIIVFIVPTLIPKQEPAHLHRS